MADYIPIIASETDPEAPLRSSLFKRLEANPRAIAEGAAGAPKIMGQALSGVFLASLSTSSTSPIGVVGVERAKLFQVCGHVFHATTLGAGGLLQARYTASNGANWGSYQDVFGVAVPSSSTGVFGFTFSVDVETGAFSVVGVGRRDSDVVPIAGSGSHTVPAGCNGIQVRVSYAILTVAASFYCLGGAA